MRDQIDDYINNILQSVLNTNEHKNIRDELRDHILSLAEEKVEKGMSEEEAIEKAMLVMGKPKDLARKFNSVYHISKIPLILWGAMNSLFLVYFSYILSQLSTINTLDVVALAFHILLSTLCLYICGRFIINLRNIIKNKVYFSPDSNKTYVQKLIYKISITLFIGFFLYFFISIVGIINQGNFQELVKGNDYFPLLNLTLLANHAFAYIVYYNYPKVILTEDGLYIFVEIPRLILWEAIKDYKWNRTLGNYHLELSKGGKYRIIQTNLKTTDKIIIDNILKEQKNW